MMHGATQDARPGAVRGGMGSEPLRSGGFGRAFGVIGDDRLGWLDMPNVGEKHRSGHTRSGWLSRLRSCSGDLISTLCGCIARTETGARFELMPRHRQRLTSRAATNEKDLRGI